LALIPHGGTSATVSGNGISSNDSKGLRGGMLNQDAQDPYDDIDDNLVVREVPAPFSGEMVDTSSSFGEDIEVSPARGDDLDLTLRVPYSRLHGELSTFFDVFLLLHFFSYMTLPSFSFLFHFILFSFFLFFLIYLLLFFFFIEGSIRTMAGEGISASLPLAAGKVSLSEESIISATEGLTQFLKDLTKEIYNDHSPRHFLVFEESFVSFLRFEVPSGCLPILESLHKRFGNFTLGFKFGCGCSSGSFYLCLLCGMLCDMRRIPLELVIERKLQDWRGVTRELIDLGFVMDFLLERIREVARMYFGRKASAEAEVVNAQITYHKEQIVQLEAKKNGLPLIVPLGNLFAGCVLTHGLID
jgi:hypothetical protein